MSRLQTMINGWRTGVNLYLARKYPFSLVHFITGRCNARCKHCFMDFTGQAKPGDELSLDEIERLTAHIGHSLYHVSITGGEPFLRQDIFEIVHAYLAHTGVRYVNISTNGAYGDRVRLFIEKLIAAKCRQNIRISISIDDIGEAHDRNRRVEGLFSSALGTYRLIESYQCPSITPVVNITVTPYNDENVLPLYAHLRKEGIKNITAVLMREEGVVRSIDRKAAVVNAYQRLVDAISADTRPAQGGSIGQRATQLFIKARMDVLSAVIAAACGGKVVSPCTAGTLFGVIGADGGVYPCEILADRTFGNLRDHDMDLAIIWRSATARSCGKSVRSGRCSCTYECAWSINIVAAAKPLALLARSLGSHLFTFRSRGTA